ncbi:MAG: DUF4410 domain-containing protein [Opitutaceae bacterium]
MKFLSPAVTALGAASAFLVSIIAVLLYSGCASVTAVPASTASAETILRPPQVIYIEPFDTEHGMWQGRVAPEVERERVRDWLMAELESELNDIAPTRLLTEDEGKPDSGWLLTGRFLRVNPGSKVQRMFIPLGAGGSKLETRVSIYDLAVSTTQPVLDINTTGGSNFQTGPSALVNNATMDDIDRTAREVHDFIVQRLWPDGEARPARPAPAQSLEPAEIDVPDRR